MYSIDTKQSAMQAFARMADLFNINYKSSFRFFCITQYKVSIFIVYADNGVFACSESNLFGVLHGMGAVFLVDAVL